MAICALLMVAALAQLAPLASSSPPAASSPAASPYDTEAGLARRNNDDALRANARKRGVAWQLGGSGSLAPFRTLASYYTYGPYGYRVPEGGPGLVPQLWGCSDAHVQEFEGRLAAEWAIVGGDDKAALLKRKELLTFNEPNEAGQANCTPARAAEVWKRTVEPLREKGWRVGAPAVNTGGWGMAWMLDWWRECNGSCHPDFLAVHFYNPSEAALPGALTQWRTTFNLPVQVTEIAPMSWPPREGEHVDAARVRNFMKSVTAWMDGTDWVERYYWYGARWDMGKLNGELALLQDSQTLSPLGEMYVSDQSPQYASHLDEDAGTRVLPSPLLLLGLLLAALALV